MKVVPAILDDAHFLSLQEIREMMQGEYRDVLGSSELLADNLPDPLGMQLDAGIGMELSLGFIPTLWTSWGSLQILKDGVVLPHTIKINLISRFVETLDAKRFTYSLRPNSYCCYFFTKYVDGTPLNSFRMSDPPRNAEIVLACWNRLMATYQQNKPS